MNNNFLHHKIKSFVVNENQQILQDNIDNFKESTLYLDKNNNVKSFLNTKHDYIYSNNTEINFIKEIFNNCKNVNNYLDFGIKINQDENNTYNLINTFKKLFSFNNGIYSFDFIKNQIIESNIDSIKPGELHNFISQNESNPYFQFATRIKYIYDNFKNVLEFTDKINFKANYIMLNTLYNSCMIFLQNIKSTSIPRYNFVENFPTDFYSSYKNLDVNDTQFKNPLNIIQYNNTCYYLMPLNQNITSIVENKLYEKSDIWTFDKNNTQNLYWNLCEDNSLIEGNSYIYNDIVKHKSLYYRCNVAIKNSNGQINEIDTNNNAIWIEITKYWVKSDIYNKNEFVLYQQPNGNVRCYKSLISNNKYNNPIETSDYTSKVHSFQKNINHKYRPNFNKALDALYSKVKYLISDDNSIPLYNTEFSFVEKIVVNNINTFINKLNFNIKPYNSANSLGCYINSSTVKDGFNFQLFLTRLKADTTISQQTKEMYIADVIKNIDDNNLISYLDKKAVISTIDESLYLDLNLTKNIIEYNRCGINYSTIPSNILLNNKMSNSINISNNFNVNYNYYKLKNNRDPHLNFNVSIQPDTDYLYDLNQLFDPNLESKIEYNINNSVVQTISNVVKSFDKLTGLRNYTNVGNITIENKPWYSYNYISTKDDYLLDDLKSNDLISSSDYKIFCLMNKYKETISVISSTIDDINEDSTTKYNLNDLFTNCNYLNNILNNYNDYNLLSTIIERYFLNNNTNNNAFNDIFNNTFTNRTFKINMSFDLIKKISENYNNYIKSFNYLIYNGYIDKSLDLFSYYKYFQNITNNGVDNCDICNILKNTNYVDAQQVNNTTNITIDLLIQRQLVDTWDIKTLQYLLDCNIIYYNDICFDDTTLTKINNFGNSDYIKNIVNFCDNSRLTESIDYTTYDLTGNNFTVDYIMNFLNSFATIYKNFLDNIIFYSNILFDTTNNNMSDLISFISIITPINNTDLINLQYLLKNNPNQSIKYLIESFNDSTKNYYNNDILINLSNANSQHPLILKLNDNECNITNYIQFAINYNNFNNTIQYFKNNIIKNNTNLFSQITVNECVDSNANGNNYIENSSDNNIWTKVVENTVYTASYNNNTKQWNLKKTTGVVETIFSSSEFNIEADKKTHLNQILVDNEDYFGIETKYLKHILNTSYDCNLFVNKQHQLLQKLINYFEQKNITINNRSIKKIKKICDYISIKSGANIINEDLIPLLYNHDIVNNIDENPYNEIYKISQITVNECVDSNANGNNYIENSSDNNIWTKVVENTVYTASYNNNTKQWNLKKTTGVVETIFSSSEFNIESSYTYYNKILNSNVDNNYPTKFAGFMFKYLLHLMNIDDNVNDVEIPTLLDTNGNITNITTDEQNKAYGIMNLLGLDNLEFNTKLSRATVWDHKILYKSENSETQNETLSDIVKYNNEYYECILNIPINPNNPILPDHVISPTNTKYWKNISYNSNYSIDELMKNTINYSSLSDTIKVLNNGIFNKNTPLFSFFNSVITKDGSGVETVCTPTQNNNIWLATIDGVNYTLKYNDNIWNIFKENDFEHNVINLFKTVSITYNNTIINLNKNNDYSWSSNKYIAMYDSIKKVWNVTLNGVVLNNAVVNVSKQFNEIICKQTPSLYSIFKWFNEEYNYDQYNINNDYKVSNLTKLKEDLKKILNHSFLNTNVVTVENLFNLLFNFRNIVESNSDYVYVISNNTDIQANGNYEIVSNNKWKLNIRDDQNNIVDWFTLLIESDGDITITKHSNGIVIENPIIDSNIIDNDKVSNYLSTLRTITNRSIDTNYQYIRDLYSNTYNLFSLITNLISIYNSNININTIVGYLDSIYNSQEIINIIYSLIFQGLGSEYYQIGDSENNIKINLKSNNFYQISDYWTDLANTDIFNKGDINFKQLSELCSQLVNIRKILSNDVVNKTFSVSPLFDIVGGESSDIYIEQNYSNLGFINYSNTSKDWKSVVKSIITNTGLNIIKTQIGTGINQSDDGLFKYSVVTIYDLLNFISINNVFEQAYNEYIDLIIKPTVYVDSNETNIKGVYTLINYHTYSYKSDKRYTLVYNYNYNTWTLSDQNSNIIDNTYTITPNTSFTVNIFTKLTNSLSGLLNEANIQELKDLANINFNIFDIFTSSPLMIKNTRYKQTMLRDVIIKFSDVTYNNIFQKLINYLDVENNNVTKLLTYNVNTSYNKGDVVYYLNNYYQVNNTPNLPWRTVPIGIYPTTDSNYWTIINNNGLKNIYNDIGDEKTKNSNLSDVYSILNSINNIDNISTYTTHLNNNEFNTFYDVNLYNQQLNFSNYCKLLNYFNFSSPINETTTVKDWLILFNRLNSNKNFDDWFTVNTLTNIINVTDNCSLLSFTQLFNKIISCFNNNGIIDNDLYNSLSENVPLPGSTLSSSNTYFNTNSLYNSHILNFNNFKILDIIKLFNYNIFENDFTQLKNNSLFSKCIYDNTTNDLRINSDIKINKLNQLNDFINSNNNRDSKLKTIFNNSIGTNSLYNTILNNLQYLYTSIIDHTSSIYTIINLMTNVFNSIDLSNINIGVLYTYLGYKGNIIKTLFTNPDAINEGSNTITRFVAPGFVWRDCNTEIDNFEFCIPFEDYELYNPTGDAVYIISNNNKHYYKPKTQLYDTNVVYNNGNTVVEVVIINSDDVTIDNADNNRLTWNNYSTYKYNYNPSNNTYTFNVFYKCKKNNSINEDLSNTNVWQITSIGIPDITNTDHWLSTTEESDYNYGWKPINEKVVNNTTQRFSYIVAYSDDKGTTNEKYIVYVYQPNTNIENYESLYFETKTYQGDYNIKSAYNVGSLVNINNQLHINNEEVEECSSYSDIETYNIGDQVEYGNNRWVCTAQSLGNTPSSTSTYWSLISISSIWIPVNNVYTGFISSKHYLVDDIIKISNTYYRCILDFNLGGCEKLPYANVNGNKVTFNGNWKILLKINDIYTINQSNSTTLDKIAKFYDSQEAVTGFLTYKQLNVGIDDLYSSDEAEYCCNIIGSFGSINNVTLKNQTMINGIDTLYHNYNYIDDDKKNIISSILTEFYKSDILTIKDIITTESSTYITFKRLIDFITTDVYNNIIDNDIINWLNVGENFKYVINETSNTYLNTLLHDTNSGWIWLNNLYSEINNEQLTFGDICRIMSCESTHNMDYNLINDYVTIIYSYSCFNYIDNNINKNIIKDVLFLKKENIIDSNLTIQLIIDYTTELLNILNSSINFTTFELNTIHKLLFGYKKHILNTDNYNTNILYLLEYINNVTYNFNDIHKNTADEYIGTTNKILQNPSSLTLNDVYNIKNISQYNNILTNFSGDEPIKNILSLYDIINNYQSMRKTLNVEYSNNTLDYTYNKLLREKNNSEKNQNKINTELLNNPILLYNKNDNVLNSGLNDTMYNFFQFLCLINSNITNIYETNQNSDNKSCIYQFFNTCSIINNINNSYMSYINQNFTLQNLINLLDNISDDDVYNFINVIYPTLILTGSPEYDDVKNWSDTYIHLNGSFKLNTIPINISKKLNLLSPSSDIYDLITLYDVFTYIKETSELNILYSNNKTIKYIFDTLICCYNENESKFFSFVADYQQKILNMYSNISKENNVYELIKYKLDNTLYKVYFNDVYDLSKNSKINQSNHLYKIKNTYGITSNYFKQFIFNSVLYSNLYSYIINLNTVLSPAMEQLSKFINYNDNYPFYSIELVNVEYNSTTTYNTNDQVEYDNKIYMCIAAESVNNLPTNTSYWSLIDNNITGKYQSTNNYNIWVLSKSKYDNSHWIYYTNTLTYNETTNKWTLQQDKVENNGTIRTIDVEFDDNVFNTQLIKVTKYRSINDLLTLIDNMEVIYALNNSGLLNANTVQIDQFNFFNENIYSINEVMFNSLLTNNSTISKLSDSINTINAFNNIYINDYSKINSIKIIHNLLDNFANIKLIELLINNSKLNKHKFIEYILIICNRLNNALKNINLSGYDTIVDLMNYYENSYTYNCLKQINEDTKKIEFIECAKGVFTYNQTESHKSNIYSIKIKNSNLSTNGITNEEEKAQRLAIRSMFENVIRKHVKRYMPAHTHLWKIEYED